MTSTYMYMYMYLLSAVYVFRNLMKVIKCQVDMFRLEVSHYNVLKAGCLDVGSVQLP